MNQATSYHITPHHSVSHKGEMGARNMKALLKGEKECSSVGCNGL